MTSELKPINNYNAEAIRRPLPAKDTITGSSGKTDEFQQVLKARIKQEVKFSGHALERLQKRNIVLSKERLEKINDAVQKAQQKGSRESLVLMDNLALIVSIKNNTVITAIDDKRIKENVFTNIDSTIVI